MIEAASTSEISVNFHQTVRCNSHLTLATTKMWNLKGKFLPGVFSDMKAFEIKLKLVNKHVEA
jgi:hypothetical protein